MFVEVIRWVSLALCWIAMTLNIIALVINIRGWKRYQKKYIELMEEFKERLR